MLRDGCSCCILCIAEMSLATEIYQFIQSLHSAAAYVKVLLICILSDPNHFVQQLEIHRPKFPVYTALQLCYSSSKTFTTERFVTWILKFFNFAQQRPFSILTHFKTRFLNTWKVNKTSAQICFCKYNKPSAYTSVIFKSMHSIHFSIFAHSLQIAVFAVLTYFKEQLKKVNERFCGCSLKGFCIVSAELAMSFRIC